jgi:hypothetical protein
MAQTRRGAVLLIIAWIVYVASAVASVVLWPTIHVLLGLVANTLILVSGSIIVRRTDQQTIGWILVFLGLVFTVTGGVLLGIQHAYETEWTRVVTEAGIGGLWLFIYLILIFPSGELPTRFSRVLLWIAGVGAIALSAFGIRTALVYGEGGYTQGFAGVVFFAVLMLAAVVIQFVHRRHRSSTEKRQLKWFLFALAVSMSLYLVAAVLRVPDTTFLVIDAIATSFWPIAILIAITRYRLYDIDRIISRTVSYAIIVGLLAAIFFGVVTAVTALLPTQNALAVAGSTLVVAALFNPVRLRVQQWVDRRFNRSHYEAQSVIDSFAATLQDEPDLENLVERLQAVVIETMGPALVGTWDNTGVGNGTS